MANKIDFNTYDYIMFVDASGDDGFDFSTDTSLCFTTACFITKIVDLEHNVGVLNKIKEHSGRRYADELKFSRFRRHKSYISAIKELDFLRGYFTILTSFKKNLISDSVLNDSKRKTLTAFTHSFPIQVILESPIFANSRVLICVDRMKEIEMKTVKTLVEDIMPINSKLYCNYDIVFKDSKAIGYELIQIADVAAGISRRFFEHTLTDSEARYFIDVCYQCLLAIKSRKLVKSCSVPRVLAISKHLLQSDFKYVNLHLLREENLVLNKSLRFFPAKMSERYYFIDCEK